MALFDMSLEDLQSYRPELDTPVDFDDFWRRTLDETRSHPLEVQLEPANYGLRLVEAFDLTFNGYGGQPIKAWLLLPQARSDRLPCVVEYIGYGGGRGFPLDWLAWSNVGFAHLVMDTRGQGSASRNGDTPDLPVDGANPAYPGFMTQGILSPETYYYRRVFTDAVRAVEAARTLPAIDGGRVAVTGGSQGGGISIAAAGLLPEVRVVMPDVPFLCHFQRATTLVDTAPYSEIANYLKVHRGNVETVFNTLSYFDGVNFATRIKAQALFSVGLMDMVCPPSTIYAAYNHLAAESKQMRVYTYNNHEGGGSHHLLEKIRFLQELWAV
jgi:cephalosporin-C deacetylase